MFDIICQVCKKNIFIIFARLFTKGIFNMTPKFSQRNVWLTALAASLAVVLICSVVISAITCDRGKNGSGISIRLDGTSESVDLSGTGGNVIIGEDGVPLLEGGESVQTAPSVPQHIELNEEMRAVWVPYMSTYSISKARIDEIIANCKALGANTIIFHVRAFGDALYDSEYFPWSHLITGSQGTAPGDGFDPLEYAVTQAHANGMQIHAWVNPLRIQLEGGKTPSALSADNPYTIWRSDSDSSNDHYVVDYNNGKYYNPGVPEVRQLIVNGVAEIAADYNVDGIHWDDYFYPATDERFDDSIAYSQYRAAGGALSLSQWRTENINTLIRDCYNKIKASNSNCVFGISPAGNIQNCLDAGANVYEWCSKEGYIDYICPQIYWSFTSKVAPFAERCAAWRALTTNENIDFYVGLALYKAGSDADNGSWAGSNSIIAEQIKYIRENGIDADGFMIYSYEYLDTQQTAAEVANIKDVLA